MDHPSWRKSVARPLEVWPYQIRSWKQVRIVKKSFPFIFILKLWKGKDLLTFLAFLDVFIQNFEIDILCIVSFNFCFILSDFCKNGCALKVVFCYACKRVQIPGDKFIKKTKELSLLCSCFSLYCFCFNVPIKIPEIPSKKWVTWLLARVPANASARDLRYWRPNWPCFFSCDALNWAWLPRLHTLSSTGTRAYH